MTLRECIAIHNSAQPDAAGLTPLGIATVAARRLAAALAGLDPQDRQNLLAQLVCAAAPGPEGTGFSLLVIHPPTPDPAA